MKKILIAVALLGLSSTAFGANNPSDYKASCESVMSHAQNGQWSQVEAEIGRIVPNQGTAKTAAIAYIKAGGSCVGGYDSDWWTVPNTNPGQGTTTGITKDELDASQKAQDEKQAGVDKTQDDRLHNAEVNIDDAKSIGQNANNNAINAQNTADVAVGIGQNANNNAINAQNTANDAVGIGQDAKNTAINAQNTADYAVGLGQDNSNRITVETSERKAADKVLQSNIDAEATTRANADIALKNNIDKNKADQAVTDKNQDKVIATKASKAELQAETVSRQKADKVLSSRIDNNDNTLVQHDERITSNTQRIGTVEGRVSNLENQTNRRFADIDKRIDKNRSVSSAGIAGAGAMANIPQVTRDGNFSVGAGIGGYDGENAVAVGFSARVTQSVTTKVSVSTNSQSEVLWGAGVGVEW